MAKPLGLNMINMYESMIKNDFGPLISRLKARTEGIKVEVERQVKIDLGVYELYQNREVLKIQVSELEARIREFEAKEWDNGEWRSPLQTETQKRLAVLNTPLGEVTATRDALIRQIRLAGVGAEIKHVFDAMPETLEELTRKYGNLEPVLPEDVGQDVLKLEEDNG